MIDSLFIENLEPAALLGCLAGIVVLISLLLYLTWTCIMREKTFEEVIAEQRRKEQLALIKAGKAIKKEKFKKKFADRRSKKKDTDADEVDVQIIDKKNKKNKKKNSVVSNDEDDSSNSIEMEIPILNANIEKKKKAEDAKARKAEAKAAKLEAKRLKNLESAALVEEEIENEKLDAVCGDDDMVKQYAEDLLECEEVPYIESELIIEEQAEEIEEIPEVPEVPEIPENTFFKELKASVEDNEMDDGEVQALVDVLLQKHSDARPVDWNQAGIDGISIEKLQAKIDEHVQEVINEKQLLDETIQSHQQDLSEFHVKYQMLEKQSQESITNQAAEINSLHSRLTQTHESHKEEIQSMRMQMENNKDLMMENHMQQIQAITEENNQLKDTSAAMVPQHQFANVSTQLKIVNEELQKYVSKQTSQDGWKKNYENKINRYEEQLRVADKNKVDMENDLTHQINSLAADLNREKEINNNNINQIESNQSYANEISNLKYHLATMERSQESLDTQLKDSVVQRDDAISKLSVADDTKADLESQLKEINAQNDELRKQFQWSGDGTQEDMENQLKEVSVQNEELQKQLNVSEGTKNDLEIQLKEVISAREEVMMQLQNVHESKAELEDEVKQLKEFTVIHKQELYDERESGEGAESEDEIKKEIAPTVEAAPELILDNEELKDVKAELEIKSAELDKLKLVNDELVAKTAELEDLTSTKTDTLDESTEIKEIDSLKEELAVKNSELEKMKLSLDELTSKMDEIDNSKSELNTMDSEIVEKLKDQLETQPIDNQDEEVEKLKSDLEVQINKNNALREKNWKAMEALSKAEKAASSVDQLKKDLDDKEEKIASLNKKMSNSDIDDDNDAEQESTIEKLTSDLEKKEKSLASLEEHLNTQEEEYESKSQEWKTNNEKLEKQLAKTTKSLSELEEYLNEQEKDKETLEQTVKSLEEQMKSTTPLSNGLPQSDQELESMKNKNIELSNTLNDKVLMIDNLSEELQETKKENQTANTDQEHTRELLRRLFPSITVDHQELTQADWLQGFELEAQTYMEIMSSGSVDPAIMERLEESDKEKEKLELQVQSFKDILSTTEETLTKLQSSVEDEEKKWKDLLDEKEDECRQLKEMTENLRAELVSKTSGEEFSELSTKYQELECKFKEFETSKLSEYEERCKSMQDKLLSSETDREYSTSKLEALEIELDDTKSKLDTSLSEKDKLESNLNSTEEKLRSYNSQLEESLKEKTVLRSKLSQIEEENESLQLKAKEKLTNGTHESTQELSEIKTKLSSVQRQLDREISANKQLSQKLAVNVISSTRSDAGSSV